jgi:UDP-N-acetylglucosamine 2-epimerase (non-hydrolysing)
MKIILVVAARPNFIKIAPLVRAMVSRRDVFTPLLVHTGQHYEAAMSTAFFHDLALAEPDIYFASSRSPGTRFKTLIVIIKEENPIHYSDRGSK